MNRYAWNRALIEVTRPRPNQTLLMEEKRYNQLMRSNDPLTDAEIEEGWHFCGEFDGLLVGPHMHELNFCRCLDATHKVYDTKPPYESLSVE